ncbi:MAG: murein biosynthesis integral membrane protein MurJ [Armatimonadota bacterium]
MSAARASGKASLLLMGFVLLSRVLGVVRDMVISHTFGQDLVTDTFTAAFRIPDILQYLVAGGALATIFVPVFTQYWTEGREDEAWGIFRTVMTVVAVVALVLVVALEFAAEPVARWMNPNLGDPRPGELVDPALLAARKESAWGEVARLSRILLPAQWCFFTGGLMMGTLNARRRFLIPALGPVLYNIGQIGAGIVLGRTPLGISSMTWGALAGAAAGNVLLPLWDLHRAGGRLPGRIDLSHPGVRKVGALMLPALLGLSLSQLGFWITGSFAKGAGYLSALRNAYNLTQAPIGIFAQASAIVLLPTISALAARGDREGFRDEIHHGIRRILFLTVPTSLWMAVLAEPIVATLYLGGRYGPDAVRDAASALWCYSVGTFAWSAQAVLARGFYALQDSRTPTVITTAMVGVFVGLCILLPPTGLGFRGLALALSIAGTCNMIAFLMVLGRRTGGLRTGALALSTLRIVAASAVSAAAAGLVGRVLWHGPSAEAGRLPALVAVAGAGGVALMVYVALGLVLRIPELHSVRALLRRPVPPEGVSTK